MAQSERNIDNTRFSVLDLVPVVQGTTAAGAIRNCLDLAQETEQWDYHRFWISEHHNTDSLVSSATSILVGQVARETSRIRVGSGGIMLPNHAPLAIAEQFGTLASLFPGRIDLGLGRAPGTDQKTALALRRNHLETAGEFPRSVQELQRFLSVENKSSEVRALPGEGLDIPLYLLGSSTFSADLAARTGLPYAFASHFAPTHLHTALKLYGDGFVPSGQLEKPYSIACVNVIAAPSDEEARHLATSQQQFALGIIRGNRRPMPPPVESMDDLWNEAEKASIGDLMHYSFIGSSDTIRTQLSDFIQETRVDEIMVVSHIHDHKSRLRSYEILSQLRQIRNPFFDPDPPPDPIL